MIIKNSDRTNSSQLLRTSQNFQTHRLKKSVALSLNSDRHNYLVLNMPNSAVKLAWFIALGKLKRLLGDLPLGAARFHYVTFEIGEQKQKYRWERLDKLNLIVEEKMLAQHLSVVA